MYKISSILCLFLILTACDDSQRNEIYNENNTTVINGTVYNIDEKPINGIYKIYYTNGNVRMEIESLDGKPDGDGKFYDKNGNLLYQTSFKNGVIDGKMYNYYENGQLHNEMQYKEGVLEGRQKTFDEDGNLTVDMEFVNGKAINGCPRRVSTNKIRYCNLLIIDYIKKRLHIVTILQNANRNFFYKLCKINYLTQNKLLQNCYTIFF